MLCTSCDGNLQLASGLRSHRILFLLKVAKHCSLAQHNLMHSCQHCPNLALVHERHIVDPCSNKVLQKKCKRGSTAFTRLLTDSDCPAASGCFWKSCAPGGSSSSSSPDAQKQSVRQKHGVRNPTLSLAWETEQVSLNPWEVSASQEIENV